MLGDKPIRGIVCVQEVTFPVKRYRRNDQTRSCQSETGERAPRTHTWYQCTTKPDHGKEDSQPQFNVSLILISLSFQHSALGLFLPQTSNSHRLFLLTHHYLLFTILSSFLFSNSCFQLSALSSLLYALCPMPPALCPSSLIPGPLSLVPDI
jgi:hypothetical protein